MSSSNKSSVYVPPPKVRSVASRESNGRSRSSIPIIAVVGITNTGKSTFIAKLSDEYYDYAIGDDGDPRTRSECAVKCRIGHQKFILVDTPGLNYKNPNPVSMLEQLDEWLLRKYGPNAILGGIIYLHDITHPRVAEHPARAYRLFRKLTGQTDTRKLILLTTKWDVLGHNTAKGLSHEARLKKKEDWNLMTHEGARVIKHDGSTRSAQNIVLSVLGEQKGETATESAQERLSRSGVSMNQQLVEYPMQQSREMDELRRAARAEKRRSKQPDRKGREREASQEHLQEQRVDRGSTRSASIPTRRSEPRQSSQNTDSGFCSDPSFKFHSWIGGVSCYQCGWKDSSNEESIQLAAGWHMPPGHVIRSHAPGQKNMYKCRVCGGMYKFKDFKIHIRQHELAQVRRAYGDNAVKPGKYNRYKEVYGKDPPSNSDIIWDILHLKDM